MVGHSGEEYEAVRQRVQVLRKQHRDIVEARRAAEHAESLASLKFAEEREAIESACRHQVDEIQRKLRDAVERSARAREHHDKEKRVLVAKLNALSGKLEEKHGAEMAEPVVPGDTLVSAPPAEASPPDACDPFRARSLTPTPQPLADAQGRVEEDEQALRRGQDGGQGLRGQGSRMRGGAHALHGKLSRAMRVSTLSRRQHPRAESRK